MAEVLISGPSHSADDGTSRTAAKCHTSVDLLIAGRASVFSQKHRAMIGHMPGERVSRFVSFHKLNTANIFFIFLHLSPHLSVKKVSTCKHLFHRVLGTFSVLVI